MIIVGEAKVRLTSVGKIRQLEKKADVVRRKYPQKEVFKILVTHFARPAVVERARERGVAVVQSLKMR